MHSCNHLAHYSTAFMEGRGSNFSVYCKIAFTVLTEYELARDARVFEVACLNSSPGDIILPYCLFCAESLVPLGVFAIRFKFGKPLLGVRRSQKVSDRLSSNCYIYLRLMEVFSPWTKTVAVSQTILSDVFS